MYEKILARSFGKLEQKKLIVVCAFLSFLLIALSFCTVLKPYIGPLPILNLQLSRGMNFKMLSFMDIMDDQKARKASSSQQIADIINPKKFEPQLVPMCDFSGKKSDFCEMNGDIRIHGNSSSIFFNLPQLDIMIPENTTWSIKLYARKTDKYVMGKVKKTLLKPASSDQEMPQCTVNHTIPAVIFSSGGYSGNFFHAFTDLLIPLYLTPLQFNGEVQFLLQDENPRWVNKHNLMLKALSNYEIIDLNKDQEIRCFKNVIIGLKSHKDFGIDPEKPPFGYSLRNFTQFVRKTYNLERESAIKLNSEDNRKPRLLIISRKNSRKFMNEDELAFEAQSLGYDVESIDARMNLKNFSEIVNSNDVVIGVHGAGLTNIVFLPENAVVIQVIPLGTEWISKIFFERPAMNMNLKYLEYKISERESTLVDLYSIDSPVVKDPSSISKDGWHKFKSIYLEKQNVRLDMSKFRTVLLEALELLRQ